MSQLDTAPESTLPYPPVYKDKKFVVLSDWDGTITTYDSNDYMTDFLGYGKDKRREGNLEILSGRVVFREAFQEMLESVSQNGHTFEECKQVLKDSAHSQFIVTSWLGFPEGMLLQTSNSIPASRTSTNIASPRIYP